MKHRHGGLFMASVLWFAPPAAAGQEAGIRVRAIPERPVIEFDHHGQYLNFDFAIDNPGSVPRELERIELSVFDEKGSLVRRQFVWSKGAASPGLLTAPDRSVPAGGSQNLFNPFHTFPAGLPLDRLRFDFVFETRGIEPVLATTLEVVPRRYRQALSLVLPVDGPAVVYDGHDFYSHHRRIPLGSDRIRRLGLTANPVRFANDLTPVGPGGELTHGPIDDPRAWYAYGALVRAPGPGTVVSAANDVPDNRIERGELVIPPDSLASERRQGLGNHLIIEHPGGVFSFLAHLAPGSLRVAVGDRVRPGQPVAAIGFSGDTGFHVHLHHMVAASAEFNTEGLPVYYDGVRRVRLPKSGAAGPAANGVRLDTGDLFESARPTRPVRPARERVPR